MKRLLKEMGIHTAVIINCIIALLINMALFEFSKYGRLDLEGFIVTTLAIFSTVLVLFNSNTCYLVYILLSLVYIQIAGEHGLYGEMIVNALVVIPVQIIGYIQYYTKDHEWEIEIKPISKKLYNVLALLAVGLFYGYAQILDYLGDPQPFFDSALTFMQLFAYYFMLKGKGIQWLFWFMTNAFALFVWVTVGHRYNIMMMWIFYLINSGIGLLEYYNKKHDTSKDFATMLKVGHKKNATS